MATNKKHKWSFENLGGSTRVKITSGADIAHLDELDPKMWTVLACPTTGLEIDEKSLKYLDNDGDGRIRINDIISTAKWLTAVIKDNNLLLKGEEHIDIAQLNQEDECGKKLYKSAQQILTNLGKEGTVISLADTADIAAIFAKTRFNGDAIITELSTDDEEEKTVIAAAIASVGSVMDRSGDNGVNAELIEKFYQALADYAAWQEATVAAPYEADTDKAYAAYQALDAKVKDYFVRARLASFSPESASALDVQTSRIESISADDLTGKTEEIAGYPIARISNKTELPLDGAINPAWAGAFNTLVSIVKPKGKALTEDTWAQIGASFNDYITWKNSKKGAEVEALGMDAIKKLIEDDKKQALLDLVAQDAALKEEADNIEMANKFMHIYRDFYRILRNFVTFHDFYDKNKTINAIFQSGRLIIDQRECRLCIKVADMGKHNTMAAASGMYLVYCDCTTKTQPGKLSIVAAVTVGSVGDLTVGKNAIYYDNNGLIWDAVITKIIENPISVGQAFWSPYRRMATTVENLINKSAADKDSAIMNDLNTKITAAPTAVTAEKDAATPTPPFDIAKFAGIFAAIGMAVGMIGTALATIFTEFVSLTWWQMILVFFGIMLLISGPAMVMAWMKLRRRNIAPLLNANGWAINASSKISIPFGETLTDAVKFPKMRLKDPYKKGMSTWKKWCITIVVLAIAGAALWLTNLLAWAKLPSPLPCYNKEVVEVVVTTSDTEQTVEQTDNAVADSTATAAQ